jgi:4-hydroxybenzoate polyprenyltransferase/phosphoserine phosphatase
MAGNHQRVTARTAGKAPSVICVDLDGCLLNTDLLHETLIGLLRARPQLAPLIPFWLLRGRAFLKFKLAQHGHVNVATLPYNQRLLGYLRERKDQGARLILATAANSRLANEVACHLGLFDDVLASDESLNLKGPAKAQAITERLNGQPFVYIGNCRADLAVWKKAQQGVLVNAAAGVRTRAERITPIERIFDGRPDRLGAIMRSLRMHQWSKNLLVLVPIVTAHRLFDGAIWPNALLALLAFSLCASAAYLVNDVYDVEHDRLHPTKSARPVAAGELSLRGAAVTIALLLCGTITAALWLPIDFQWLLGGYFLLTLAYSMFLRRLIVVDVIVLATLYTLRVVGGQLATGLATSHWLLAFSMFIFLSLALMKRYIELSQSTTEDFQSHGRGYEAQDTQLVGWLGTASAYMAVLIFALYINSETVRLLYANPLFLWAACPVILYWISRVWILAHRGAVHDDPVLFVLKDKVTYVVLGVVGLILLASHAPPV